MKSIILSIAIAFTFASCSTEPNIEMRSINPTKGFNEVGKKIMEVQVTPQGGNAVKITKNGETFTMQYTPNDTAIIINDKACEVVGTTENTITYKDNGINIVIEFNTGYIWQETTKTKFDIYKQGERNKAYSVYTYNN